MHRNRVFLLRALALSAALYGGAGHAATFTVSPGISIQKTIDKAKPGDTVQVLVGQYNESIVIDKANVTLIGLGYEGDRPVLVGSGEFEDLERAVAIRANDVTLEGFVIRNYRSAGVVAEKASGTRIRNLIIDRPGRWGIRVEGGNGAEIENCVVGGAEESGIYIENSISSSLRANEAFANEIGIRIENCTETVVENNSLHGNSVGLALLRGPGEYAARGSYCRVTHSRFMNNNRPAPTASFPAGIGVLIVAADYTEIAQCSFSANGAYAAMVMAYPALDLRGEFGEADDSLPLPDHTYIHHNRYLDNGTAPPESFKKAFAQLPPGDLYWDGTGERNQWQEDAELRTVPDKLVQKHGGAHTNVMHFL